MGKKQERLIHTRMGQFSIPAENILVFPRGLIGFEGQREFTLIRIKEESPFLILQSMSDPGLGLLVADPFVFMTDYKITVGEPEQKLLKLENSHQMAVLVTVTIPHGEPEQTTLNLAGPIVINHEARVGMQIPQVDSDYPSHYKPGADGLAASGAGSAGSADLPAGGTPEGE
jgi:flagellar assembly factor FliW